MEKVGDIYLLTNIERQYLGLIETERHWKLEKITERCWVYYEEDNLRKIIEVIQEGENNMPFNLSEISAGIFLKADAIPLVEVAPCYDINQATSLLGAKLVLNFIAYILHEKKKKGQLKSQQK